MVATAYNGYRGPDANTIANNYAGSYDEWFTATVRAMVDNYIDGVGQTSGQSNTISGDPNNIGQPNSADFNSRSQGNGQASLQTYHFFSSYVEKYGASDPWISDNFGRPPTSNATYESDPNQPSVLQRDQNKANIERDAANNASSEKIAAGHDAANVSAASISAAAQVSAATISANASMANTRAQVDESWKEATLRDATDRYIAEGNWGVQKYVAELSEKGQTDRLQLELGMRDKELAEKAVEEKDRHHETMVNLALEVAKYDADLAGQPRNWIKYAAWLADRNEVINGMNLAMAAETVPDSAIPDSVVANSGAPFAGVAGQQQIIAAQTGTANTAGGQNMGVDPTTGQPYNVAGVDLTSTDYAGMTNQLLGANAMGQAAPPTTEQLQAVGDSISTQGQGTVPGSTPGMATTNGARPDGRIATFGATGLPTINSLGMTVDANGAHQDYRKFVRLLPSAQEMNVGAVESVGGNAQDYGAQMDASRPKGGGAKVASYG